MFGSKMDEIFGGVDGKQKLSMADSTMMLILHSSMNKAHEKVRSKEGVLERLSEQSKFYELAIMQLEACTKFIQVELEEEEEADDNYCYENQYDKLLNELTEIKNRLCRRLSQTEMAIAEMDRELIERADNVAKLRQSLEERHEGLEGQRHSTRQGAEDDRGGRDGDICELKNSVDQQFWNIKQQWEEGRIKMKRSHGSSGSMVIDSDSKAVDIETDHDLEETETDHVSRTEREDKEDDDTGVDLKNAGPDQTASEIDRLRETLDMAFGMMQNTILVSEVRPMEMQWRWMLEKETMFISFKQVITDIQKKLDAEWQEKEHQLQVWLTLSKDWSELTTELTSLRYELDAVISPINEAQGRSIRGSQDNSNIAPALLRTRSPSPVADRNGRNLVPMPIRTRSPSPVADRNYERGPGRNQDFENEDKDSEDGSSNLEEEQGSNSSTVAKMIRTHETIIRQKSEELNWLKAQILREKGRLASARECNLDGLKKSIQNAVDKLDDFSKWNDRFGSVFSAEDNRFTYLLKSNYIAPPSLEWDVKKRDGLTTVQGESEIGVSRPEQCTAESCLRLAIAEEIQNVVFGSLVRDLIRSTRLHDLDAKSSTRQNTCIDIIKEELNEHDGEITKGRKNTIEESKLETGLMDEVFKVVCYETLKDMTCTVSSLNQYQQDLPEKGNSDNSHEFSNDREDYLETSIIKDIMGVLIKEMAHAFCEHIDACKYESLVLEKLHDVVVVETLKEYESSFSPEQCTKNNGDIGENAGFIGLLDFLLTSLELEENSVLPTSAHSSKEANENVTNLLPQPDGLEYLPDEDEVALSTVNEKLEEALQRLDTSKMLLKELSYDQGAGKKSHVINSNNSVPSHDQKHAAVANIHVEMQLVRGIPKDHEGVLVSDSSDPLLLLTSLEEFPKHLVNFELLLHQKLDMNASRLEKLMDQIDPLLLHVSSLQEKELLYKQAFLRRCENLQKAEAEVDILGDQVDALLGLLEKIYATLDYYSPVLQQYSGVLSVLTLIKKELNGEVA